MATLQDITPLTSEEGARLTQLMSEKEEQNGVSVAESTERTSLIFKSQANMFKALATDEHINKKADDNYERLAISNWEAVSEEHK